MEGVSLQFDAWNWPYKGLTKAGGIAGAALGAAVFFLDPPLARSIDAAANIAGFVGALLGGVGIGVFLAFFSVEIRNWIARRDGSGALEEAPEYLALSVLEGFISAFLLCATAFYVLAALISAALYPFDECKDHMTCALGYLGVAARLIVVAIAAGFVGGIAVSLLVVLRNLGAYFRA